jgi:hypothetical protein
MTIQELLNSSETLKRFIRRLPHLYKADPTGDEPQESSFLHRWLYALAHEDDELWANLKLIMESRSIDLAFGYGLEMLAQNFGITRKEPWTSDEALRNRLRFRILELTCHGTPREILELVARYIWMWQTQWAGAWDDPAWGEIVQRLVLTENEIPQYLDGQYRMAQYELSIPYDLLEIETYPAFELGDGTDWEADPIHGFDAGLWDGRTMLTELYDLLIVASAAGVYPHIWRDAFEFGDGTDWEEDAYRGFDAAPLSDAADTFVLRTDAEWDYPLDQGVVLEGFPIVHITPHPNLAIEVP